MTSGLIEALRLAHGLSAAVWVGGAFAYFLVRRSAGGDRRVWGPFREALRATIGVFLVTGAFLAVQRLSSAALPPTYVAALAVKVALALAMFGAARRLALAAGPPVGAWWQAPEVTVLGLGVAIYALAIALRAIYEETIRVL